MHLPCRTPKPGKRHVYDQDLPVEIRQSVIPMRNIRFNMPISFQSFQSFQPEPDVTSKPQGIGTCREVVSQLQWYTVHQITKNDTFSKPDMFGSWEGLCVGVACTYTQRQFLPHRYPPLKPSRMILDLFFGNFMERWRMMSVLGMNLFSENFLFVFLVSFQLIPDICMDKL